MARTSRKQPATALIKNVIGNVTARAVLGKLSIDDLDNLNVARLSGELSVTANKILSADDPSAAAAALVHPVAQIFSKLSSDELMQLKAGCPPGGC